MASDRADPPCADAGKAATWRAPAHNGESLIVPSLLEAAESLRDRALRRVGTPSIELDLAATSRLARSELLSAAVRHTAQYANIDTDTARDAARPLVLAGHQPTLFHPGVWLKDAALGWFAREAGALAINVNVDNDTLKSPAIRVPGGTPASVVIETEFYDAPGDEVPYEERAIADHERFNSFGGRVADRLRPIVRESIVETYWPRVRRAAAEGMKLGDAIAAGRHRWELERGNRTLEAPLSELCRGEAFRRLVAAWLLSPERARDAYNDAILEYRTRYHVRSRNHPAPLLEQREAWIEAPLWCWSTSDPRRRRLFVCRQGSQVRIGPPNETDHVAPATPEGLMECLDHWERAGWKVRPRALFTTLFLRLLAGDLFIHGIGGALYDRVTDQLMRDLFGVAAPPYVVATATVLLPGAERGATSDDLRRIDADVRDRTYHPEQSLAPPLDARAQALVNDKRRWIATAPTKENARERSQAFTRINHALATYVAGQQASLVEQRERLLESLRGVQPLRSREYAFCLFPEKTWPQLLAMLPPMP